MRSPRWLSIPGGITLVVVALAGTACGGGGSDTSSDTTKPGAPAGTSSLQGGTWVLHDPASLVPNATGVVVSARFDGRRASGDSGCNTYRVGYQVDGNNLAFDPNIVTTRRACDAVSTAVETAYLKALPTVKTFTVSAARLTMANGDDKTILVFDRTNEAAALVGSWRALSYYDGSAVVSDAQTGTLALVFDRATVSGSGGCNEFDGPYKAEGVSLRIGPLAATQKACVDPAANTREQAYFAALEAARTFAVSGNRLDLFRADGGFAATFESA
jgi:heat shock protein HslJ